MTMKQMQSLGPGAGLVDRSGGRAPPPPSPTTPRPAASQTHGHIGAAEWGWPDHNAELTPPGGGRLVNTKKPHTLYQKTPFWPKMHRKTPKNVPEPLGGGGWYILGVVQGVFWYIFGGFSVSFGVFLVHSGGFPVHFGGFSVLFGGVYGTIREVLRCN